MESLNDEVIDEIARPNDMFVTMTNTQKQKEINSDIWKYSPYKVLPLLKPNNVGIVGEMFIQNTCVDCNISADINGLKTKELGGGAGDGLILDKSVEIKTSHMLSLIHISEPTRPY